MRRPCDADSSDKSPTNQPLTRHGRFVSCQSGRDRVCLASRCKLARPARRRSTLTFHDAEQQTTHRHTSSICLHCRVAYTSDYMHLVMMHSHLFKRMHLVLAAFIKWNTYPVMVKNFMQAVFFITREAAWLIISVDSVCLSVCQTITFERLHVWSSYLHIRCTSRQYGSSSYMKVIGSRPRSQDRKVHNRYTRNGYLRVRTNLLPRSVKVPSPVTRRL